MPISQLSHAHCCEPLLQIIDNINGLRLKLQAVAAFAFAVWGRFRRVVMTVSEKSSKFETFRLFLVRMCNEAEFT